MGKVFQPRVFTIQRIQTHRQGTDIRLDGRQDAARGSRAGDYSYRGGEAPSTDRGRGRNRVRCRRLRSRNNNGSLRRNNGIEPSRRQRRSRRCSCYRRSGCANKRIAGASGKLAKSARGPIIACTPRDNRPRHRRVRVTKPSRGKRGGIPSARHQWLVRNRVLKADTQIRTSLFLTHTPPTRFSLQPHFHNMHLLPIPMSLDKNSSPASSPVQRPAPIARSPTSTNQLQPIFSETKRTSHLVSRLLGAKGLHTRITLRHPGLL